MKIAGRLYSRFRSNLSKNFNFWGPTPLSLHRWGSPPPCQISPPSVHVSPLRGEKPQNRPLSKRNTGRFALRAMLPVTSTTLIAIRTDCVWPLPLRLLIFFSNLSKLFCYISYAEILVAVMECKIRLMTFARWRYFEYKIWLRYSK